MELVDVYDKEKKRTGKRVERGSKLQPGEFFLVAHLCLFDPEGRLLIQQRSPAKANYPGCWDLSAGGFVRSGESSADAIVRETGEELGLKIDPRQLQFILCQPFSCVLDDFFFLRAEPELYGLRLQPEELSAVSFARPETVWEMLEKDRFVDYEEELMKEIFAFEKAQRLSR